METFRRSVALLIETSNSYGRGLLHGIVAWQREHEAWSIYLPEQSRGERPPEWFSRWHGDGIIARVESPRIADILKQTGLPVVDVSAGRHLPDVPWVETDDAQIASTGFEHLAARGFQTLAFCSDPNFRWSTLRRDQFQSLAQDAGLTCHIYEALPRQSPEYSGLDERKRLRDWVARLPRPIGVMACYDIKAQELLDVCRELQIAVPEEIAVLGVDDSQLICELCDPPLSSVSPNTRHTGYTAAVLLDRMMSGQSVPSEAHLIEPTGVTTRQSTDILAIDDPEIATALRFIRDRAFTGITVAELLRHVPISRRMLESRFKKYLGRTPHEELTRLRMNRAKRLLIETDLTLAAIAERAGFEHTEYFSTAFKREVGQSPREFRRDRNTG